MTSVMYCDPIEFWNALIAVSGVVPQQIKLTENDSYNCRLGWYMCWARILISMEFTRMKCYYICTVYRVMYTFIVAYITWTCRIMSAVFTSTTCACRWSIDRWRGRSGCDGGGGRGRRRLGCWRWWSGSSTWPGKKYESILWLVCSYQLVTTLASQW